MTIAETIITNAAIRSMDPGRPIAEAIAIAGGRILALGRAGEIAALAGPQTERLDAGGRLMLPGFHDTHIHLMEGGQHCAAAADLSQAQAPQQIVETLRAFAATRPTGWVLGGFYNSGVFGAQNLNARLLDAAAADRPCYILAADGHNGCINTRAMEQTGLSAETPDPDEGRFVRGPDGAPTGLLHEGATAWIEARLPPPTAREFAEGVRYAQALANRHGITGVLDARVVAPMVQVYQQMADAGALTLRVIATALVLPSDTVEGALARLTGFRAGAQHEMFGVHSAKFFFDGVMENRTAAMIEDYSDQTGGNAPVMFSPGQIADFFTAFDAARFQIHVHCIGDGAVRAALDGMEAARKANGAWPSRHHIAHIQMIDPADIARFAELGVVANVQPLWARNEPAVTEMTIPVVGPERSHWIYAFASLRAARAEVVLSSDWTVSTLNPFEIIETAITRRQRRGDGNAPPLLPEQSLGVADCVAGYTSLAARAGWRDGETGSLTPGKWADLIVLDRDIFAIDPHEIGGTEVVMTMLAGKAVHGGL